MGVEVYVGIYWAVAQNLMPPQTMSQNKWQMTHQCTYSAQRILPGPSVRLQATQPLKSQIRVYCFCLHTKCQHINETWFQSSSTYFTFKCITVVPSPVWKHTQHYQQSSFWKAALGLNKAKDQPALRGHSKRERFMVNRPRFRLDSNSCWEICKLTAATFKMPLFLFIFN